MGVGGGGESWGRTVGLQVAQTPRRGEALRRAGPSSSELQPGPGHRRASTGREDGAATTPRRANPQLAAADQPDLQPPAPSRPAPPRREFAELLPAVPLCDGREQEQEQLQKSGKRDTASRGLAARFSFLRTRRAVTLLHQK